MGGSGWHLLDHMQIAPRSREIPCTAAEPHHSVFSRVALYQASVSGLCDGTFACTICRSVRLSVVCMSVCKVYYGKTAEWIRMPFGTVSGVDQGMSVLDGGRDH